MQETWMSCIINSSVQILHNLIHISHTFYFFCDHLPIQRPPHDPWWPESGIGLASEFGVGDDGDFCNWRCGWYEVSDVNNGVLGYQQAQPGQSFLKIGVGELVKGSCSSCDSTEIYNFNSPYKFAKTPKWNEVKSESKHGIALEQEIYLNEHGYKLTKDVWLEDNTLKIKHTLINLGRVPFATAWYSHHFFTCDSRPVDVGYEADLNLPSNGGHYSEPGTWSWSQPIDEYAKVKSYGDRVMVRMDRPVEASTRIKAEFQRDDQSDGGFTVKGCGTSIDESILEVNQPGSVKMYAYNFYIESGTFSPEPQYYMHLYPGETTTWTQQLVFRDSEPHQGSTPEIEAMAVPNSTASAQTHLPTSSLLALVALSASFTLFIHWTWRRSHTDYTSIPDL